MLFCLCKLDDGVDGCKVDVGLDVLSRKKCAKVDVGFVVDDVDDKTMPK